MKKHIWKIIVLLLVLMQGISYLKMKELGQQILILSQAMDNSHFAYNYRMTEMQKEFEDAIKKQNSILEKTELLFGELDEENMTFSITYLIIPKAISDNTKLYVTINGEKKPMKQDGIVFSHTETYGLFSAIAQPYVVIEDDHSSNLEQMRVLQLERLPEAVFPAINIDIEDTKVMIREKYQRVGTIQYDNKPSEYFPERIRYTSAELVVLHDDTVVASYPVDLSQRQVAINVLVDMKKGQTATMMMVLKDNLNLEYRYLLERYTPGSSKLMETFHDMRSIYQNGKLLHKFNPYDGS